MRALISTFLLLLLAAPAGATIVDDEPTNDGLGTATTLTHTDGLLSYDSGMLSLGTPGDEDWVSLGTLLPGSVITAVTTPLDDAALEDPDTVLTVHDGLGSGLVSGDDAENHDGTFDGLGSLVRYLVTEADEYFVSVKAFSASAEDPFATGSYVLSVSVKAIPEPTTGLLMGLGLSALALRARRRA